MRTPQGHQATVALEQVKRQGNRLTLQAQMTLELPMPDQDADLPKHLEAAIESGGQALKRRLFQQAIEQADRELVLAQRHGKQGQGIVCRGTTAFTFKTVFGTVKVRRQRIEHRADGSTEIPAAHAWQTPRQVALTAGLCDAVCDGMLAHSARRTVARIEERADEAGLLSKTTVLEIVHDQGRELQRLAQARAAAVFEQDPEAAAVLLPGAAAAESDEEPAGPGDAQPPVGPGTPAAVGPNASVVAGPGAAAMARPGAPATAGSGTPATARPSAPVAAGSGDAQPPPQPGEPARSVAERPAGDLVGFAGGPPAPPEVAREEPRQVDPGTVLVELDEVKVHAQPKTGHKQLVVYTALVMAAGLSWHFAAATGAELAYQVGALLAVLEVHRGTRSLLALADGARWSRDWFERLALLDKAMIVCWYHLKKRCEQCLSRACRGRDHRRQVEAPVLDALWHGRVGEAIAALRTRAGEMKNPEALEELIGYLEARRPYLPDYEARQRAGLWIASNRVEKFNDWSVAVRCKHRGMEWTAAGVVALASLEAARRNGELPQWRAQRSLPAWEAPPADRIAA
jgi:hypothetical protein